ncbi:MAG TPA: DUF4278 domain-containing protein [Leptolyngbyaceae cyanobacterium M65_K2018_010]|nr:DUF4278 domain-containing protein [Leptolyngbyaceae cyanobacterium M65_K2018_010]
MKLTYRGVSYDYTPNPVPPMGPVFDVGSYRGATVAFRALAEVPPQPSADLTWRGVPYRSGTPEPARPAVPIGAAPTPTMTEDPAPMPSNGVMAASRNLFLRHHQRIRRREQGMMVRLAAEVGLPVEAAARYESQIQGKLPHDFAGYDRSATAMS